MIDLFEKSVEDSLLAERVAARNRKSAEDRKAGIPMIGLFWFDDGKILFPIGEHIKDIPSIGGSKDIDQTHYRVWNQLHNHVPKYKSLEYEDVPRGRIVYKETDRLFIVYSSRKLKSSPAFRRAVINEFNLPASNTKFFSDLHYEDPKDIDWD